MKEFAFEVFKQIPDHLQSEVESGKKQAFHEDEALNTTEKRQKHDDRFCSQLDRFMYLVAFSSTHVVGSMTLLKRKTVFEGKPLLVGGIGGIWTHEDYRNQGIATRLLQKGMDILKENNCDIAYLCTDVENPARIHLYGKVGFVPLHKPHVYLGKSGKKYTDTDGMIAPLKSEIIFQKILNGNKVLHLGTGNW